MVNAQEWLDKEYPLDKRATITELDITSKELTGELSLAGFNNLTILHSENNNLTNLDISNCSNLTELICFNNNLTNLDISNCLGLTEINCPNNNLTNDLTIFSKFINLKFLLLGNDNELRIKSGIYNRWTGSLEPLKNLTKLEKLCIEGTDVDNGLEYLPDSLNEAQYDSDTGNDDKGRVYCSPKKRPGSKVAKIKEQLKPFNYNLGKWKAANKDLVAKVKKSQTATKFNDSELDSLDNQIAESEIKLINTLVNKLTEIKAKLSEQETKLTTTRSLLDKANSELITKTQELTDLKDELEEKREESIFNYFYYKEQIKVKEEQISSQQAEITTKTQELTDLKTQLNSKDELIKTKEVEITTNYQALVISNRELDKLKADYQTQQTKINELESQLTGLALGSGLLVKQVEDLTNQKTQAEQATERIKLAKEINDNLLKSKENELKNKNNTISEQATKLNYYQNLIRNSEANLAKAQAIILTKTESLEKLEQERNNLQEELENAEEKIKQLETSLLTSQTKISELETRIKGLELNLTDDNKLEITNLRKQLAQEKTNSKQQITQLQTELTKLKTKEAQLSLKIKNLTTKQEIVKEEKKPATGIWATLKTPLLIGGGIVIILFTINWLRNKFKSN